MNRYAFINSLKGYAICGIIAVHLYIYSKMDFTQAIYLQNIFSSCQIGVQLFFILSSYTIFISISKKQTVNILEFYCKRLIRLLPLFYIMIVAYSLVQHIVQKESISIWNILSHLILFQSVSPYWINTIVPGGWFLSTIFLCYLVTPLLFKKIRNAETALLWLNCSIVGYLIIAFLFSKYPLIQDKELWNSYLYMSFPAQLPVFIMGIVLFYLVEKCTIGSNQLVQKQLFVLGLILVTSYLSLFKIPKHILAALSFAVLFPYLKNAQAALFNNVAIRYLGNISFSIYLIHIFVLYVIREILLRYLHIPLGLTYLLLLSIGTISVSIILASISYQLIEKRLSKVLDNLLARATTKTQGR